MKKNIVLLRPTQTHIDSLIKHAEKQLREAILFNCILKECEETSDMLRREKNNIVSAFIDRCIRDGVPKYEAQEMGVKLKLKIFNDMQIPKYKDWCHKNMRNYFDAESQSLWMEEGFPNES